MWGGESSPVICFMFFWDDALYEMTNKNAGKKRADNPDKHKSPWRPISILGEMKASIVVCVAIS